jgi:hypothetical protein
MDLPKCKICGEKHRLGPCPQNQSRAKAPVEANGHGTASRPEAESVSRVAARRSAVDVPAKQAEQAGKANAGHQGGHQPESVTAGETAHQFDRVAYHREYMREYMRKRRAAQKEAKQ